MRITKCSPSLRTAQPHPSLRGVLSTSLRGAQPHTSLRGAKRRGNLFLLRHCRLDRQSVSHHQSTNRSKSCLMVSFSASVHAFSPPSVNKTAQNLPVGPVDVYRQNSQPVMLHVIASGRVHHVIANSAAYPVIARSAATWQSVLAICSLSKIPRLVALTWNDSETTGKDSGTAATVAALSSVSSVDLQRGTGGRAVVQSYQQYKVLKNRNIVDKSKFIRIFAAPKTGIQNINYLFTNIYAYNSTISSQRTRGSR